jgi:hypothetical protein
MQKTEAFMKSWKHILLIAVVMLSVLSLFLSACAPVDNSNGNPNSEKTKDNGNAQDPGQGGNTNNITICHKTGSAKNPYVEITVSVNATTHGHGIHEGDLIPAPEGGCPTTANDHEDNDNPANKITICHKTGSTENPYVEITVSVNAATHGHGKHEGDLIPAPESGCPTTITDTDIPAR